MSESKLLNQLIEYSRSEWNRWDKSIRALSSGDEPFANFVKEITSYYSESESSKEDEEDFSDRMDDTGRRNRRRLKAFAKREGEIDERE